LNKVLITGACGYLGANLSYNLSKNGFSITAFDSVDLRENEKWSSQMGEIIVGDIRDEKTISNLVEREFDTVIHLISLDHKKSEDLPNIVSSINVMPTWNLLDKFTKKGLKKFIYLSTIQIYGDLPPKKIDESFSPAPNNIYGLTHYLSEKVCNYYNKTTNTNCINVRLSNSYGSPAFKENNCWWLVINDLCKSAFDHNQIKLLSDGTPQRDFIHSYDIYKVIEKLINTKLTENIYHIASGKTLTILELANKIQKIYIKRYNKNLPIISNTNIDFNKNSSPDLIKRYNFDISKIKSIGYKQKISLEIGINNIFDYFESINS
jgi:UDP-glucose 4-epimerase